MVPVTLQRLTLTVPLALTQPKNVVLSVAPSTSANASGIPSDTELPVVEFVTGIVSVSQEFAASAVKSRDAVPEVSLKSVPLPEPTESPPAAVVTPVTPNVVLTVSAPVIDVAPVIPVAPVIVVAPVIEVAPTTFVGPVMVVACPVWGVITTPPDPVISISPPCFLSRWPMTVTEPVRSSREVISIRVRFIYFSFFADLLLSSGSGAVPDHLPSM